MYASVGLCDHVFMGESGLRNVKQLTAFIFSFWTLLISFATNAGAGKSAIMTAKPTKELQERVRMSVGGFRKQNTPPAEYDVQENHSKGNL